MVDVGANIIFGAGIDAELKDEVIVTIIATGFNGKTEKNHRVAVQEDAVEEKAAEQAPELDVFPVNNAQPVAPAQQVVAERTQVNQPSDGIYVSRLNKTESYIPAYLQKIRSGE